MEKVKNAETLGSEEVLKLLGTAKTARTITTTEIAVF